MENLYSESSVMCAVELPSKGRLYEGKIPGGKLNVRAMTAREEKLIYGGKGNISEKMEMLLSSCVQLPSAFSPSDLLISDRFFLLIKIRLISFGSEYPIQVRCPDCDNQFIKNFDLTELNVKTYDNNEEKAEPFLVTLPVAGKTIGLKILRGKDENAIHKYAKGRGVKEEVGDPAYTYSLARSIVSFDQKPISQIDALQLVEKLVSRDTMELRHALEENDCGVDTDISLECPKCSFLIETRLPVTEEFFRPKRKSLRSRDGLPI
jgi:hypothetical protein